MDAVQTGSNWNPRRLALGVASLMTVTLLAGGAGGYLFRGNGNNRRASNDIGNKPCACTCGYVAERGEPSAKGGGMDRWCCRLVSGRGEFTPDRRVERWRCVAERGESTATHRSVERQRSVIR